MARTKDLCPPKFKKKRHFVFFSNLEASCIRLKVELDSDSVVAQEYIDSAVKFGVDLGNPDAPIEAKKYVLTFIQKLLLQREKLDLGILTDYLHSGITKLWQEVLDTLEKSNRKLVAVQSGSLILTLFCPTFSSAHDILDDSYIKDLTLKMENFVNKIGRV